MRGGGGCDGGNNISIMGHLFLFKVSDYGYLILMVTRIYVLIVSHLSSRLAMYCI